jgi:hypothetical protein
MTDADKLTLLIAGLMLIWFNIDPPIPPIFP